MEVGPGSEGRCVGRSARHLSGGTASGHGRLLRLTLAQLARLRRPDDRPWALVETLAEFLAMDEPRRHVGAMIAGLDIRYDFGGGHPLLGRRMPDLDLVVADVANRVSALLHAARPVLIDFGPGGHFEAPRWADRVRFVKAEPVAAWSLPGSGRSRRRRRC